MSRPWEIPVDEYSTPSPYTARRDSSILDVYESMKEHGIRHVPVVDDQHPIGMITDRDLQVLSRLGHTEFLKAESLMTPNPYVVTSGTPLAQAAEGMFRMKLGSAIVTDEDGDVVGIFTSTDALHALCEVLRGSPEWDLTLP